MRERRLIDLSEYIDARGSLAVAGRDCGLPFEIRRCFWIYGVPEGESRAGHAHKRIRELIVAVAGSFRVTLEEKGVRSEYVLDNPRRGLLVEPMVWLRIEDFSPGAVCLVLSDGDYDPLEYLTN